VFILIISLFLVISLMLSLFFLICRRPALSRLFPYSSLFRSLQGAVIGFPCAPLFRSLQGAVIGNRGVLEPAAVGVLVQVVRRPDAGVDVGQVEHRRRRPRSEEHTSELQSRSDLVCRLLLEKKKKKKRKKE